MKAGHSGLFDSLVKSFLNRNLGRPLGYLIFSLMALIGDPKDYFFQGPTQEPMSMNYLGNLVGSSHEVDG